MRVGTMHHLVTIRKLVKTQDSMGGKVEQWQDFAQAYAEIKPVKGSERFMKHERHATATHQIITRYIAGVDPKMRIEYQGRIFHILSALDSMESHRLLTIIAEEDADVSH